MDELIKESFRRVREDFEKRDNELALIKTELNALKQQLIPKLLETNQRILERLEELESRLPVKRDVLKEQLLQRYTRKRREIVMDKILEVVAYRELTLPELKTIIVDENSYCSRSSFYRYVDFLRRIKRIEVVEVNGVELVKPLSQRVSH